MTGEVVAPAANARLGNSPASRDKAYHLHPYTHLKRHEEIGPSSSSAALGATSTTTAVKEYIEGLAGLWCAALGFGEQRLIDAATRQMQRLPYCHGFGHKSHDPVIYLAEKLIGLAPVPMSKVLFSNSGSEASDTAVKLVWYYNNAVGRHGRRRSSCGSRATTASRR